MYHAQVASCFADGTVYRGPDFEVMFSFLGERDALMHLQALLLALGESVTMTSFADSCLVHVHVDDPDAVLARVRTIGDVSQVRIVKLIERG